MNRLNEQYKSQFDQERDIPTMLYKSDEGASLTNVTSNIFAGVFGVIQWFIGLKWYVILLVIVFGSFLFLQVESAFETRRQMYKSKKEGMHDANDNGGEDGKITKMKSILRQIETENMTAVNFENGTIPERGHNGSASVGIGRFSGEMTPRFASVRSENANKHISFEPVQIDNSNNNTPTNVKNYNELWTANFINIWLQAKETIMWIYKLWIVPRIYALFRNIGPITERGHNGSASVGIGR